VSPDMRYLALACDYDGTLASEGTVAPATVAALERLRQTGRKLVLVTGRDLPDLLQVFPGVEIFDQVVAENGALLYRPDTREEKVLGEPPPEKFVQYLRDRHVTPLSVGQSIVATCEPNQNVVLEAIKELGVELHVIFNKGSVMVLPSGVNKATGLAAALAELKLSAHNVVGVGDGENDHALLNLCECSVAVANAVPLLRERADFTVSHENGAGVTELIDCMVASDLKEFEDRLARHEIAIGKTKTGEEVRLRPYGLNVMIAGTSGGGKSKLATAILEKLSASRYQFCVIDPEGDFTGFISAAVIGEAKRPPDPHEIVNVLRDPQANVVVNMLGVRIEDRPSFFEHLWPQLQGMRAQRGRPHWLVIDECHHVLPRSRERTALMMPQDLRGILAITVHPGHVSEALLSSIDTFVVVGESPAETVSAIAEILARRPGSVPSKLEPEEALLWKRSDSSPCLFQAIAASADWRRHQRKYAVGELGEDRSFYFRGPEGKLNLRAQNLNMFLQIGRGLDDETWMYHLRNGDYSRWFREKIKDEELAGEAEDVQLNGFSISQARDRIEAAIRRRYTAPE
jgi:HAD superfamily hydrolase (TIGR01484 family)